MAKLTKTQIAGLRWIAANEPVKWWPVQGGVHRPTRIRLHALGLTEHGKDGVMQTTSLTDAGRAVLAETEA